MIMISIYKICIYIIAIYIVKFSLALISKRLSKLDSNFNYTLNIIFPKVLSTKPVPIHTCALRVYDIIQYIS